LQEHIEDLIKREILEECNSNYASPAFTRRKKNNDIRLIGDFRKLNEITVTEHFPFPDTHNIFLDLKGSKIYSTIDLNMGFHQILINPEDTHKTAISINGKKYKYLRIPFGMKNAPFSFQKNMIEKYDTNSWSSTFCQSIC
ncbi:putative LTR transposon, partial [Pseudoloma neurophilia]